MTLRRRVLGSVGCGNDGHILGSGRVQNDNVAELFSSSMHTRQAVGDIFTPQLQTSPAAPHLISRHVFQRCMRDCQGICLHHFLHFGMIVSIFL